DSATSGIYSLSYTTLFRSRAGRGHHRSARDRSRAGPRSLAGPRISSAAGVDMLDRLLLIGAALVGCATAAGQGDRPSPAELVARSEEHTSELQSRSDLVCR